MSRNKALLICGKIYCLTVVNKSGKKDKKIVQILNEINSNHFNVWDTIRGCVYPLNSEKVSSYKELRVVKSELLDSNRLKKSYS